MAKSNPHLHWFNLKCPYPQNSTAYKAAKARLHSATYADLERLRAEFDMYRDGSIPVSHYNIYDEWFASIGGVKTHQVNTKVMTLPKAWIMIKKILINPLTQRQVDPPKTESF